MQKFNRHQISKSESLSIASDYFLYGVYKSKCDKEELEISKKESNKEPIEDMVCEILGIMRFLKLAFTPQIASFIEGIFKSDDEKIAFEHSDGRTTSELEKVSGIKKDKMTSLWKKWFSLGLGTMVSAKGGTRFVKSLSLKELGIEIPKRKKLPD